MIIKCSYLLGVIIRSLSCFSCYYIVNAKIIYIYLILYIIRNDKASKTAERFIITVFCRFDMTFKVLYLKVRT